MFRVLEDKKDRVCIKTNKLVNLIFLKIMKYNNQIYMKTSTIGKKTNVISRYVLGSIHGVIHTGRNTKYKQGQTVHKTAIEKQSNIETIKPADMQVNRHID